jgi:hypothetical protein
VNVARIWRVFAAFDLVLVLVGAGLLAFVLASGEARLALVVFGALALRVALWRHSRSEAVRRKRQRDLRRRRLARERAGLAPRRD